MRSVLVTGATGFIGCEVARRLAERGGVRVKLLVRRAHRAALVRDFGETVAGRLEDHRSLERAVAGADTVVHLAARATFEPYDVLRPTMVEGAAAMARAAASAGVESFVFASTTVVYDGRLTPVDERTPAAPWCGYGRAKLDAESALRDIARGSGMRVGVLRLPHVYGARDAMFGGRRSGWIVCPGPGTNPFSHLHVADAARLLVAAAERRWAGTAPVADDEPATWRQFLRLARDAAPGLRELRVPRLPALAGAWLLTAYSRLRARPTLRTPDAVRGWNLPLVVAPGTAWAELGIRPLHPTVRSGVPAALAEQVPPGWVHSVDDHRP